MVEQRIGKKLRSEEDFDNLIESEKKSLLHTLLKHTMV